MIALRCAPFGLCSDGLGGKRIPSSMCGVYGFKPTGRRISKKGEFSISGVLQDVLKKFEPSIGPVANSSEDLI